MYSATYPGYFGFGLFCQTLTGGWCADNFVSTLNPLAKRFGKRRLVLLAWPNGFIGTIYVSTVGISHLTYTLLSAWYLAFGMGLAMSPTTDLLMSAVPKARAGMGSAMNDTVRELGGALGVALLGSLLASDTLGS